MYKSGASPKVQPENFSNTEKLSLKKYLKGQILWRCMKIERQYLKNTAPVLGGEIFIVRSGKFVSKIMLELNIL